MQWRSNINPTAVANFQLPAGHPPHRLHKGARRLDGPAAAVIAKCRSFPTLPDSRYNIGTIDGRRKNGFPAPKRHQAKHLGFWSLPVRDQGVGGSNPLSPTIKSRNIN